jgi:hypothetical protein
VGYDAIAVVEEEQHLRVPIIGREWPAMRENNGLTGSPIFVENLSAIFRRNRAHVISPCVEFFVCGPSGNT